MKAVVRSGALGGLLLLGAVAYAAGPARNVRSARHLNLAAAHRLGHQAFERVIDAQRANEWEMGGHPQKTKDLLDQAGREPKLAAQAANRSR